MDSKIVEEARRFLGVDEYPGNLFNLFKNTEKMIKESGRRAMQAQATVEVCHGKLIFAIRTKGVYFAPRPFFVNTPLAGPLPQLVYWVSGKVLGVFFIS